MRAITEIIVHCSATMPKMDIGADEIREWHTAPKPGGRGWRDIGYHYVIRRNGKREDGRPVGEAGAHVAGRNANSIGVCLVGGIDDNGTPDDNFTGNQMIRLRTTIRELRAQYPSIRSVIGHRDVPGVAKACPCFNVGAWLAAAPIDLYPIRVGDAEYTLTRAEIEALRDRLDAMLDAA